MRPSRRQFIAASSAALVGLGLKSGRERRITGSFVNESFQLGHMLRDRRPFPATQQQTKIPVVIVGGGMAGLSAAWYLDKRGFRDFVLLEMEPGAGGNSRWGENEVSAYPWAAHYVPIPNKSAVLVRELFEELGVLKDGRWEERYLCFAPQERLFIHGRWQEGVEPTTGLSEKDREQFRKFDELIQQHRASGEFTIPLDLGFRRAARATVALDRISISQWLDQHAMDSPYLRWLVDYICRDDYGASAAATSAWAGVHYFAAREHEEKGPLTWPEGNGWIARRLIQKLARYIRPNSMVHSIAKSGRGYRARCGEMEYIADAVIFAAPTFLAPYVIEGMRSSQTSEFVYSPWLTANLTLDRLPRETTNAERGWDNVIYNSPSLGYVVANHQSVARFQDRSVWTFYWALAEYSPREARTKLLSTDWNYWKEEILSDLEPAHPDIRDCVSQIDIMRMGHAMIRPTVGFISSEQRNNLAHLATGSRLVFANSDLSGISIFEEAQYRGVEAARAVLNMVSGSISGLRSR